MFEKAENYEEAKKILKEIIDSEYEKHKYKVAKYRALLVTGLGLGAAAAAGIIGQDPALSGMALAPTMIVSYPFVLSYYVRYRVNKKIRNGEYFKERTESELIDTVNKTVDQLNEAEQKGMIK